MVITDNPHERHHGAPSHHNSRQPPAGAELLEQEVAGDLEGGVGEEEGRQAPVVLVAAHAEVLLQALDLGVADVAAVEEGEQVQQREHGDQAQVHLAQDRPLVQVPERVERRALGRGQGVDALDLVLASGVPMAAVLWWVGGDRAGAELVLGDIGLFVL